MIGKRIGCFARIFWMIFNIFNLYKVTHLMVVEYIETADGSGNRLA